MIALAIAFIAIFYSIVFNKRIGETFPISLLSLIIVLYIFGLFNILLIGVYFILIVSILSFLYSIYIIIKDKTKLKLIFNPSLLIFIVLILFSIYTSYGMTIFGWDEFSHWATVVKSMFLINDFGTNPLSYIQYQSYPPALSLIEYFEMAIHGSYTEWLLYFSYKVGIFSLLISFTHNLKWNNYIKIIINTMLLIIVPMVFFTYIYDLIYSEPFLSILFVYGAFFITYLKNTNLFSIITICLILSTLILTKDIGVLLAILLLVILFIIILKNKKLSKKNKVCLIILFIGISVIAKLSWDYEILINDAVVMHSQKINIKELIETIFVSKSGIKYKIIENFLKTFMNYKVVPSFLNLNSLYTFLLLCLMYMLLYRSFKKVKNYKISSIVILSGYVLFIIGLIITYSYKMDIADAVITGSYNRYISIYFMIMFIFIVSIICKEYNDNNKYKPLIALLIILLFIFPYKSFYNVIGKYNAQRYKNEQSEPMELKEKFEKYEPKENSKIFLITRDYSYFTYYKYQYVFKPYNIINFNKNILLSYDNLFTQQTPYTPSLKEWKSLLMDEYDYVIILDYSRIFREKYGSLFENANSFIENGIYLVNKDNGTLKLLNEQ